MEDTTLRWAAHRRSLAGFDSFATMFLLGVTISLLGPSLPSLAARTGITLPQAGIFFTLFSGGSVVASLFAARYLDRPFRHHLVVLGTFVMGAGLLATAAAESFAMVAIAISLTGVAMSTAGTTPNAIVADVYGARSGKALNLLHFVAGIGAFIGPLLVGAVVQAGLTYAFAYRVAGVATIAVATLWAVSTPPIPRGSASSITLSSSKLRPLLVLLLLAALYTGTEQTIGGWLFTYAQQMSAASATAASAITSLFWLAILLGRLAASQIVSRLGNRSVMILGTVIGMIGIATIVAGGGVRVLIWTGVVLVGCGFGPIFPTALAMAARRFPENAGMTSALIVAFGSIGAMLLPLSAGGLIPLLGIRGTIASTLIPLTFMCVCLAIIDRSHR